MTPIERIDQYLNNQLPAEGVAELERDLQQNFELQKLLDSVKMTRRTIRTQAIRAEVRRVHQNFIPDYRQQTRNDQEDDEQGAQVIPLHGHPVSAGRPFGWIVRIAATVLLAVVGYSGYQFATVDRQAVYDANFVGYQLPTTRGVDASRSVLDSLYRMGDYAAVVQKLTAIPAQQRQPRQHFLTAMSHLQLRQYEAALSQFQALKAANRQRITPYFEQEAGYYEAMAYLGAGKYDLAHTKLERIHNDPWHMFHANVSRVSLWKIKLLAYK